MKFGIILPEIPYLLVKSMSIVLYFVTLQSLLIFTEKKSASKKETRPQDNSKLELFTRNNQVFEWSPTLLFISDSFENVEKMLYISDYIWRGDEQSKFHFISIRWCAKNHAQKQWRERDFVVDAQCSHITKCVIHYTSTSISLLSTRNSWYAVVINIIDNNM